MRLSDLKKGKKAVIIKVHGYGLLRKRLSEIGFIRGNAVHVVRFAPLGDPVDSISGVGFRNSTPA